jgi:hypothetical protein
MGEIGIDKDVPTHGSILHSPQRHEVQASVLRFQLGITGRESVNFDNLDQMPRWRKIAETEVGWLVCCGFPIA